MIHNWRGILALFRPFCKTDARCGFATSNVGRPGVGKPLRKFLNLSVLVHERLCHALSLSTDDRWIDLRPNPSPSLRFVRSNELANVGRHVQQLQPLFFVQGHGKAPHPVDRDGSLSLTFMRILEDAPFLRARFRCGGVSSSAFQVFVGHFCVLPAAKIRRNYAAPTRTQECPTEDLKAELERLRSENAALKRGRLPVSAMKT